MSTKIEQAVDRFGEGFNCSQAVVGSYCEEFGLDREMGFKVATGFGGGMHIGKTCGAVTGAFMVIGLYNSKKYKDNASLKEASMSMIRKFEQDFKLANGTISCKDLINCDLNTEAGQTYYKENNLAETICEKCISNSITLINKLITD